MKRGDMVGRRIMVNSEIEKKTNMKNCERGRENMEEAKQGRAKG